MKPLLSGICGSDLATIAGRSSFYFSPLVSLPFVPGHEVVGELLDDCGDLDGRAARRAVRGAGVRGARAAGPVPELRGGRLRPVRPRHGGRSEAGPADRLLRRHRRRMEPHDAGASLAAVGGARRWTTGPRCSWSRWRARSIRCSARSVPDGADVLVIGAGTVGILTLIALRRFANPGRVIVGRQAPAPAGAAQMAGADEVVRPEHALKAVRRTESRGEAHARAGTGLPAGRRRRGVRVHGVEERARHGAAHDEGGRARGGERASPGRAPTSRRCGSASWSWWARTPAAWRPWATGAGIRSRSRWRSRRSWGRCWTSWWARRTRCDRWREAIDHAMSAPAAGHVQGGVRAAGLRHERARRRRCPDQDSCWRWTSGRPRCWCTRARASACRSSRWARAWCTRRTRCPGSATSAPPIAARAAAPGGRLEAAARAAVAGHEAHDRDRRHLDPAAADAHARHPPADPRARDRAGRAQGRGGRGADHRHGAAPPDDRRGDRAQVGERVFRSF